MTRWTLHHAAVLDHMRGVEDASVDAILSDVPYGLGSKQPTQDELLAYLGGDELRTGGDFMGAGWHVPSVGTWKEIYRALKPGGHAVVFGGARTGDLIALGLRAAGFEIRDCITWNYFSAMPKSLDVAKAIDKLAGLWRGRAIGVASDNVAMTGANYDRTDKGEPITEEARHWSGWGSGIKPAQEPIWIARKPLEGTLIANLRKWGVGALNIDGTRIPYASDEDMAAAAQRLCHSNHGAGVGDFGLHGENARASLEPYLAKQPLGRWPANAIFDERFDEIWRMSPGLADAAREPIERYFSGYDRVQGVRYEMARGSSEGGAREVLQSEVLGSLAERESARPRSSDEREKALSGVATEDADSAGGCGSPRPQEFGLEGREAHHTRIRDDRAQFAGEVGGGEISGDGADGASLPAGAPPRDGAVSRTSAHSKGDRPPPERREVGQSNRKSRAAHGKRSQEGALGRNPGDAGAATGERPFARADLEVLLPDIPKGWLAYFEPTGLTVRSRYSSAAVLDAMAGDRPGMSGGGAHAVDYEGGMFGVIDSTGTARNDSGGPSRFHCVVKPTREERELGCDALPLRTPSEAVKREEGSVGINNGRAGAGRTSGVRNHGPCLKPVLLTRYLATMVLPPPRTSADRRILIPYVGTGSEAIGAILAGWDLVEGIERDAEWMPACRARVALALANPRAFESFAVRRAEPVAAGQMDLFGGGRRTG